MTAALRRPRRAVITLVGVFAAGSAGGVLSACGTAALSATTTCQQFMQASAQDQQQVIDKLATQFDKPDYATPLGSPDVSYYCASNPTVTLGQFFTRASD